VKFYGKFTKILAKSKAVLMSQVCYIFLEKCLNMVYFIATCKRLFDIWLHT